MQIAQAPLKWLYPWASQNTNIFELPATDSDPTRASQSQGFPADTMLPPESGGVPPQGIDFNAGLYQVARIAWWLMYGGAYVYDSTFATNVAIGGYAQGSEISSADYLGKWRSTVDNNQAVPDTAAANASSVNWVPSSSYGAATVTLTNTNVILTYAQAAKKILVFTGTLTGNVVVTLPPWVYEWCVLNQCSGAFTLTLTTASGSGAVVPQGGSTRLRGDGTNINFDATNTNTPTGTGNAVSAAQIQNQTVTAFTAAGTAPNYTLTVSPAITAYAANQRFRVKFSANGTLGSNTLNINGLGAVALMQFDAAGNIVPVQILSGLLTDIEYNGTYMLVLDPAPQTNSLQSSTRNLQGAITTAAATASWTVDEIIAKTALGGGSVVGNSLTLNFNGTTTGAGGMDTGTLGAAVYFAVYAIYNPTTATWSTLGQTVTAAAPETYGGAHMPSGYVYSCLISALITNASSLITVFTQKDRSIDIAATSQLSTTTQESTFTSFNVNNAHYNAKKCRGFLGVSNTSANTGNTIMVAGSSAGTGAQTFQTYISSAGGAANAPTWPINMAVARTLYYTLNTNAGAVTGSYTISGYDF